MVDSLHVNGCAVDENRAMPGTTYVAAKCSARAFDVAVS